MKQDIMEVVLVSASKEDKRIVKTKKLIKRTVIELMREKEVQNITVTDIAEKAEIIIASNEICEIQAEATRPVLSIPLSNRKFHRPLV